MKNICFLLALTLALQELPAQTANGIRGSAVKAENAANAPLFLSITGEGRVFPFDDGQMLRVGREYTMIAIPDRGFVFSNWMAVNVFAFTYVIHDPITGVVETNTSIDVSPAAEYTGQSVRFRMQPVEVIIGSGAITVTRSAGWQANFVEVPNTGSDRRWWQRRN